MGGKRKTQFTRFVSKIVLYALSVLYHITFGLYVRIAYNLKLSDDSGRLPTGPFVLLANHCNNFDGLLLQCLLLRPISFVVTDTVFKTKALGALLTWAGYIRKRKFSSDAVAVRQIVRTAQSGGIIGIFPEGMRSWDGHTMPVSPATFKLIRMLKIPVVTARIMGSYLSGPRWANTRRRGRVEIKLTTLISSQEIRSLGLREITDRVNAALAHDEASWEAQKKIPFRGKALAEGFERLLYLCPECGQIGTIATRGSHIHCLACGAEYMLDVYGRIHAAKGCLPADNAAGLNAWQYERLKEYIAVHAGKTLIEDECARLFCSESTDSAMRETVSGTLKLTRNALIIQNLCFYLSDISGIALNFKSGVMFRHGENEYVIRFDNPRVSVHKWGCALEIITGNPVG